MITPQQTLAAARKRGLSEEALKLRDLAVLTFSKTIFDLLEATCDMKSVAWISAQDHPYAAATITKRGRYQGMDFAVLIPPMGASPLACILEDLIASGTRTIFLVCAAWTMGDPLGMGNLFIPTFALDQGGTSIHYGHSEGSISADRIMVDAIVQAAQHYQVEPLTGGVASCEALYRITPQMVADFRDQGCLCMDNGEAATLFMVTQRCGARGGVLFQPYLDLNLGWDHRWLSEDRYRSGCLLQADIVLQACSILKHAGILD
jgi:hypothetical protein